MVRVPASASECQRVVDEGVAFANQQGIFHGASQMLRQTMPKLQHVISRNLAKKLVGHVAREEAKLKPGERLPLSTEIVESSFGRYKNLERQHSKGGFTSLVLGFGALLANVTPERIRQTISTNSVRDVQQWVRDQLGTTMASKRVTAYKECKPSDSVTKSLQTV